MELQVRKEQRDMIDSLSEGVEVPDAVVAYIYGFLGTKEELIELFFSFCSTALDLRVFTETLSLYNRILIEDIGTEYSKIGKLESKLTKIEDEFHAILPAVRFKDDDQRRNVVLSMMEVFELVGIYIDGHQMYGTLGLQEKEELMEAVVNAEAARLKLEKYLKENRVDEKVYSEVEKMIQTMYLTMDDDDYTLGGWL